MSVDKMNEKGEMVSVGSTGGFGDGLTPESIGYGMRVGDRWGAYWLHADGIMRLYPPTISDCTEPERAKCPRMCHDFCNAKESSPNNPNHQRAESAQQINQ